MKKRISGMTMAVALLLELVSAVTIHARPAPADDKQTLTGVISDTMCAKMHMAKDKSAAECTRMCVKNGQGFALVSGDTVYALKGHSAELDKLAGEKVTVTGTVSGKSVAVDSVAPAK